MPENANFFDPTDRARFLSGDRRTGKYHLSVCTTVTEKMVGVSGDFEKQYRITWELVRTEKVGERTFMIFIGWGTPAHGGHSQFEYHEIGIEQRLMRFMLEPFYRPGNNNSFPDNINLIIGLENIRL